MCRDQIHVVMVEIERMSRCFSHMQGNTQEELPEVALGGVRINALDLMAAQPLDLSAPAPRLESSLTAESPIKRR